MTANALAKARLEDETVEDGQLSRKTVINAISNAIGKRGSEKWYL
jgi:hypothetical protein